MHLYPWLLTRQEYSMLTKYVNLYNETNPSKKIKRPVVPAKHEELGEREPTNTRQGEPNRQINQIMIRMAYLGQPN